LIVVTDSTELHTTLQIFSLPAAYILQNDTTVDLKTVHFIAV